MENKIVLVTGSTDGIGKQTALELAKKNAYVLIHGKDTERCHKTVSEIAAKSGNNKLQPFVADLSSLTQVKRLAQQINQQYQHLDVLINNAGVYEKSYRESESSNYSHNIEARKKLWELSLSPWHGRKKD